MIDASEYLEIASRQELSQHVLIDLLRRQFGTEASLDEIVDLALLTDENTAKTCTYLESSKFIEQVSTCEALAVICRSEYSQLIIEIGKIPLVSESPQRDYFDLYNKIAGLRLESLPDSQIDSEARIHPSAQIAAKGVFISNDSEIGAKTVIREGVFIGPGVQIMENCIIGSHGFEYKRDEFGDLTYIKHDGYVEIEENVKIGPGVVVGQGFWRRPTVVGEGTKIDHLVGISHGSNIGPRTLIAAGSIISGSVKTGTNVWIGPGSVISNGITIGNDARIALGSVVTRNVDNSTSVFGNPARVY